MTSVFLFLLLSLLSVTVLSLPTGASNRTKRAEYEGEDEVDLMGSDDESLDVSDLIETANVNLGQAKGDPHIEFGDIAMGTMSRNAASCTATGCKWRKSSNGIVYVPVSISSLYSEAESNDIIRGLVSFHRGTCIRFVWRWAHRNFLHFYPGNGCWSYLGRQRWPQLVSLKKRGCLYLNTIQHEVLHALGFHHEQVRSDRDNHVTINTDNIQTGKEHNFKKRQTNNLGTPYDYNSVMHYGRYAFSKDYGVLPTIVPKPDATAVIGRARQMSTNDIKRVNKLYQCRGT